ncbi:hypothetical protein P691DRAFT_801918 [Macrolepiota fuliginosa MF-IS2]|uniref:Uncharacterized protein n=1 Tax=Macrolepiota fuliginosa MF-IS2 TaxID=1400762 RepID=A0A9P6C3X8_9AGAR|nr:hypothetical protein P691DRAFT_801918 [Macrolepiota fuliginosa MF-IS2]
MAEETEKKDDDQKPFPDLPVDIVRLIFEKAMEATPMPVHFALVSRRVQHWVEPLIYRNLTFRHPTSFTLFYRTLRNRRYSPSKSTSFFAKHVKSLHIVNKTAPKMERMIAIGRVLKGLRATAGWDTSWGCFVLGFLAFDSISTFGRALESTGWRLNTREMREGRRDDAERRRRTRRDEGLLRGWVDPDDLEGKVEEQLVPEEAVEHPEDTYPYKDLRRLSISAHSLRILHLDLTNRLFRDITHLDIYYCRLYDWSTLTTLKNLTHVAIDFLTLVNLNFTEMKHCMGDTIRFCQQLPHLKAIIFACVNWWSRDFDLLDDEHDGLSPLNYPPDDWQSGGPLILTTINEHHLHYFTQLSLGMHDPRVVLGVVSDCLRKSHLMKEYMVDFVWPKNSHDWDFTVPTEEHKESWDIAEEIIEMRVRRREERRQEIGVLSTIGCNYGDESEYLDGEFGFGEIVRRRWKEGKELVEEKIGDSSD